MSPYSFYVSSLYAHNNLYYNVKNIMKYKQENMILIVIKSYKSYFQRKKGKKKSYAKYKIRFIRIL